MKRKVLVQSCKSKANNKAYKAKTSINNKIIHYIISKVASSREYENRKISIIQKRVYMNVCACVLKGWWLIVCVCECGYEDVIVFFLTNLKDMKRFCSVSQEKKNPRLFFPIHQQKSPRNYHVNMMYMCLCSYVSVGVPPGVNWKYHPPGAL